MAWFEQMLEQESQLHVCTRSELARRLCEPWCVEKSAVAEGAASLGMPRRLIEVFHRTIERGCRIELRQSTAADNVQAALAIDAVVAWRVMALTKLGREVPNVGSRRTCGSRSGKEAAMVMTHRSQ